MIDYGKRTGKIWYNNELVDWQDVKLHVLSHGLHYASCVFEGERVYDGSIFKLEEHTSRFFHSAKRMGFEIPYSEKDINSACNKIISVQNVQNGYVRPVAWRGSEMMAISAQQTKIHVAIATWEWGSYFDPKLKIDGIKLNISEWRRPAPNTIPWDTKASGLYMICTLSKHEAEQQGYSDSLMLDHEGNVAEATGANIFFRMSDGNIHTPLPKTFLNGITRTTIIDLLKAKDLEVIERDIELEELKNVTECFLTGTAAEVTPVGKIAEFEFKPGNLCKEILGSYSELVRA